METTDKPAQNKPRRNYISLPPNSAEFLTWNRPAKSLMGRLGRLLWPYHEQTYPGRWVSMAEATGLSKNIIRHTVHSSGDRYLTVPIILAAEKFCRSLIAELSGILGELEVKRAELEAVAPRRIRGFLEVRVRDSSGIPRRAQRQDEDRARKLGLSPVPRRENF